MAQEISFKDFEDNFINSPDGYLSVWFSFSNPKEDPDFPEADEPEDSIPERLILKMDMMVPSRLSDGKVKFLQVIIDTKEQYEKSIKYLRNTQQLLHESLENNFTSSEEELQYVKLE